MAINVSMASSAAGWLAKSGESVALAKISMAINENVA